MSDCVRGVAYCVINWKFWTCFNLYIILVKHWFGYYYYTRYSQELLVSIKLGFPLIKHGGGGVYIPYNFMLRAEQ